MTNRSSIPHDLDVETNTDTDNIFAVFADINVEMSYRYADRDNTNQRYNFYQFLKWLCWYEPFLIPLISLKYAVDYNWQIYCK